QLPLSESHSIVTGKRLTWRNRYSTAATIRSRTSSPAMPPVVARKLMASRSLQSSANATRTRSPLSQPISKPSEHQRRLRSSTAGAVMAPLVPANVAIEQQAVNLHDPVDALVIGRFLDCSQRLPLENGWETVSGQFGGYLVVREEFRSH